MDFNLVVVAGRLAASPDLDGPNGTGRLLLTVRTLNPSRVDLLPISAHVGQIPADVRVGDRLSVAGRLQRRFSTLTGRSRIEIVALHLEQKRSSG